MNNISLFTKVSFFIVAIVSILIFYRASRSRKFLLLVSAWTGIQLLIGSTDFYTNGFIMPPRVGLLIFPPLVLMTVMFFRPAGKAFIEKLDVKVLTLLHTIRIPVELGLYALFVDKTVPEIMTFEGRNLDILAGLTAPIIYFLVFKQKVFGRKLLIIWNLLSIGLLMNIVVHAILSFESPFQRFGFEQPNVAIAHAPFNLLPSVIVPLVLFSHLVVLWRVLRTSSIEQLEPSKG